MINVEFDDIRPYRDEEIPAAMKRISETTAMPLLASYIFPDKSLAEVKQMLLGFKSIRDFQLGIMYVADKQIIKNSISEFTYDGNEPLEKGQAYMFVSNHRDIMLDASLQQMVLVDTGFETSQITFGANLMMNSLVVDIGKSNKMFKVERPGDNIRKFYRSSLHLSEYIRHTICDDHDSVWIAQRNGRTKDGDDKTDQGIIKMFCMSRQENKIEALASLHIVPISISYEWESCDILKALELYESRSVKYIKKPGEDLNSILTGIVQRKGRVHCHFCPEITEKDLQAFSECTNNEYHKQVAHLIDTRIISNYKLWPNNYIAYDIQYGQERFTDRYTQDEKNAFLKHLSKLERYDSDVEALKEILLSIYANPVKNKLQTMKEKIKPLLEDLLPLVDLDSDYLFTELDSLGITTILMTLSSEFGIELESNDATPKNFKSLDSLARMVEAKLAEKDA